LLPCSLNAGSVLARGFAPRPSDLPAWAGERSKRKPGDETPRDAVHGMNLPSRESAAGRARFVRLRRTGVSTRTGGRARCPCDEGGRATVFVK